jgi:hypothetical protein
MKDPRFEDYFRQTFVGLFWIPVIIGGVGVTWLFSELGWIGGGGGDILGLGGIGEAAIGIGLIFAAIFAVAKMPGNVLKWLIGLVLGCTGLYLVASGLGVI